MVRVSGGRRARIHLGSAIHHGHRLILRSRDDAFPVPAVEVTEAERICVRAEDREFPASARWKPPDLPAGGTSTEPRASVNRWCSEGRICWLR